MYIFDSILHSTCLTGCFSPPGFSAVPQVFPPAISFNRLGQLLPEGHLFNVPWRGIAKHGRIISRSFDMIHIHVIYYTI